MGPVQAPAPQATLRKDPDHEPKEETTGSQTSPAAAGGEEAHVERGVFAVGVWQANGKALLGSTAEFAGELELQYDYPDEYVVFLDDWVGEGRKRRLVRRVLAHGPPEET